MIVPIEYNIGLCLKRANIEKYDSRLPKGIVNNIIKNATEYLLSNDNTVVCQNDWVDTINKNTKKEIPNIE